MGLKGLLCLQRLRLEFGRCLRHVNLGCCSRIASRRTKFLEILADSVYLLASLEQSEWLLSILLQQRFHYAFQKPFPCVVGVQHADFGYGDWEGGVVVELSISAYCAMASRVYSSMLTSDASLSCCFSY